MISEHILILWYTYIFIMILTWINLSKLFNYIEFLVVKHNNTYWIKQYIILPVPIEKLMLIANFYLLIYLIFKGTVKEQK